MKTEFRKNTRLTDYDYKDDGYYFVTVVTRNRLPVLRDYKPEAVKSMNELSGFIKGVTIDYFVVMDNHIHVIFILEDCKRPLGQIVRAMKYNVTKLVAAGLPSRERKANSNSPATNRDKSKPHGNAAATDKGIWQWNYYEHVIRNEKALKKIREYVVNNPEAEKINFEKFYE